MGHCDADRGQPRPRITIHLWRICAEPKFPQAEAYDLLLTEYANGGQRDRRLSDMVVKSLTAMGTGGMYDHVEGGWFRYSTTRDWSIPHFEKMLEDHAKLLVTYLNAYQVTHDEELKSIAVKSLGYLTTVLYDPSAGPSRAARMPTRNTIRSR